VFSGLSQFLTPIKKIKKKKDVLILDIAKPENLKLKKGDSINIDGVCSTVINSQKNIFQVEYMSETIRITKPLKTGDLVNIEPSLKIGDLLGGHLVSGHVDCTGIVKNIQKEKVTISFPKEFSKYVIHKGSIAVNGISLTCYDFHRNTFKVSLIPYTLKYTNLSQLKKGSKVNLEFDQIAKYVEKISKR
jgi:riboflavin synthase